MRKSVSILVLISLICSVNAFAISKNEPLQNLGKGADKVVYGAIEIPDSNTAASKGEKACSECTDATKDDVGRGIARIVGGLWQMATFWYPKSEYPTSK